MSDELEPVSGDPDILDSDHPNEPRRPKRSIAWPIALVSGTIFVVATTMTPTLGARRSTRLQWEHRAAEIDQDTAHPSTQSHHD